LFSFRGKGKGDGRNAVSPRNDAFKGKRYDNKKLSQNFSDMLYRVDIRGKPSFVYLLFEHKSYMDRMIAFQFLRNMV